MKPDRKRARRDPFEQAPTRARKSVPFPFVLDELASLDPFTRPMFGCLAVYVGERIVLILRDKGPADADSGVWVGFAPEHEEAVGTLLPRLEPIEIFEGKVSGWKKLSSRSPLFEDDVMRVCAMIQENDRRIGKIPGARRPRPPRPAENAASAPGKEPTRRGSKPAAPRKGSRG